MVGWHETVQSGPADPTGKAVILRIRSEAGAYTAKYRDGEGIVRDVATGCRDTQAAQSILADLERRAERIKANVLTLADAKVSDHQNTPLPKHLDT